MKIEKISDRLWSEPQFHHLLPKAVLGNLLSPRFESCLHARMWRHLEGLENRRQWLLFLGLSWLAGLLVLLAIFAAAYVTSYFNFWSWIFASARGEEPPMWIFWLGDARYQCLALAFVVGALPALISGWGFWMWFFVPIAVFPSVMSLPTAWMLILSERAALWIRAIFMRTSDWIRRDLYLRTGIALLMILALGLTGPAFREWVQFWTGAQMRPDLRVLQVLLGLGLLIAAETILVMGVMHFYFNRTSVQPRKTAT